MKFWMIAILPILLFIGCGSSGGGDEEPPVQVPSPVITSRDMNITYLSAQTSTSQVPLVVILVDFTDKKIANIDSYWSQQLFGTSPGELNHYFNEISQGSFSFSKATENSGNINDGIIKVTLATAHPDPVNGIGNFQNDIAHPALAAADPYINFASYDTNFNGEIERNELQIMFLTAGGEQATGLRPGIWAHMSYINGESFDGVSVMQYPTGSYTVFGERHFAFDGSGNNATIGIMAHELGHGVFNLPDLYDIDGSSAGIGGFGLMGSGSWGYKQTQVPGESPSHMSAWSKFESSFLVQNDQEINNNNIPINATGNSSYTALKVPTQNANEYFLLENRSISGYDAGLYMLDDIPANIPFAGGLAIWHIDESQTDNRDDARRLVDLVEADSFYLDSSASSIDGKQTNLFYAGNNAAGYLGYLSPTSTPDTTDLNSGEDTGITIANISVPAPTMYLDLEF